MSDTEKKNDKEEVTLDKIYLEVLKSRIETLQGLVLNMAGIIKAEANSFFAILLVGITLFLMAFSMYVLKTEITIYIIFAIGLGIDSNLCGN